jgi:hypothetical protein
VRVEESLESHYTCLMCLKAIKDPVACVPCGHVYCRCCLESTGTCGQSWCQECGGASVLQTIPIAEMEKLSSKHELVLSALRDLQLLCKAEHFAKLSSASLQH